jgi:hypothetical protein
MDAMSGKRHFHCTPLAVSVSWTAIPGGGNDRLVVSDLSILYDHVMGQRPARRFY